MHRLDERWRDRGYSEAEIAELLSDVEVGDAERAIGYASELLHRVFLRVSKDSIEGRALSRALGFTNDTSLERAAADFGVKKQYLHTLQTEIERKLRELSKSTGPSAP